MVRSRRVAQVHRDSETWKKKKRKKKKKKAELKKAIQALKDYYWNHEGKCKNGWDSLKVITYRLKISIAATSGWMQGKES